MSQSLPNAHHAQPPGRRAALAAVTLAVLGVHASLLRPAAPRPAPPAAHSDAAWQVRAVAWAPTPATSPATSPAPALEPARLPAAAELAPPTPTQAQALSPAPVPVPTPPHDVAADPLPAAAQSGTLPVYATRPADPVTLAFEVQRGERRGRAQLAWRVDGDRYALALAGDDPGPAVGAASQGRIDNAGLAPERFVDRRGGRDRRATNFDREGARIRFSASAGEQPLPPGAQDRLSWLLQLSAVLQADPAQGADGAQIALWVAGVRGDAAVWIFEPVGRETLDLPAGPVADALHLRRRAPQPYALQVDVWLDPARQHLPVRMRQALPPGPWVAEWRLLSLDWGAATPPP